ncbi:tail fiber assembly protein [Rosenbergiella collisarenosi]|uniref:tail fiber assembly protein n=1 Tax=Rosenbergiella collisarenosi TaxID=1544695 RepID=UPI001BDA3D76|nr:tail fiber assembly protein [Rosenbergiella collisarenosi]MBT0721055.1 tail fiber assembly protein [Rosenbergiella collisarenosi]
MKLLTIKNFEKVHPSTPEQLSLSEECGVIYLQSADGQDWYECQKRFRQDTMKLCFDANNVIRMITRAETGNDVSSLWPEGMSVTELKDTPQNRRADITGGWIYVDEKVVERELSDTDRLERATDQQRKLIKIAAEKIAPLQDALDLEIATEEETQRLKEWKRYRVMLSRVELNTDAVIWPEQPV